MALKPLAYPKNHLHKREQQTIEIVKALRETGFTESEFDKQKQERVFKCSGFTDVRLSIKEGRVSYGSFSWIGDKYGNAANFIKQLTHVN